MTPPLNRHRRAVLQAVLPALCPPACAAALAPWAGLAAAPAMAQGTAPADPGGFALRRLDSRHLSAPRGVRVQLPASHALSGTQTYPLLVVLGAQAHFAHVAASARFLSEQGDIPELIVVGVDSAQRVHDYTQTDAPHQFIGGGGAHKFRRFIAEELLPQLDREWRGSGEHLLFGHSGAGQFALHLLAVQPELFDAYLVFSPSLFWDDRLPVRELQAALQARERLPALLYLAEEPALGAARDDQLALRQVLQQHAPRGLQVQISHFPAETHGSLPLAATVDALRLRYHGHRLQPDEPPLLAELASQRRTDALGERYALLARRGRAPQVPERALLEVAQAHFQRQEPQAGLALLRRAAAVYPWSPASREALAEALALPPKAPSSR